MFNPKKLEEIAKQVSDSMPEGVKSFGEEIERKVKQVLQSKLSQLDMVSREEFEAQTQVLLRTREKIATLEARLDAIEKTVEK